MLEIVSIILQAIGFIGLIIVSGHNSVVGYNPSPSWIGGGPRSKWEMEVLKKKSKMDGFDGISEIIIIHKRWRLYSTRISLVLIVLGYSLQLLNIYIGS
ncbi:MAG: hypothetical protein ACFFG0_03955 [Candidatus Thorarchaeota archaeon]